MEKNTEQPDVEGRTNVSDTDNSKSVSDTEAHASNDEGGSSNKKKKKKKHRHLKKNRESESSGDEGGGKKKRKKKKKKKKKTKKNRDESETEGTDDDENSRKGGGNSTTDFDSEGPQITKRAPKKINRGGVKTDPADWSKEDLMDKVKKFATFTMDKKLGAASLVIAEKKILDESMKVLTELFNRNTEIQTIVITKCFLVDDTFTQLMERGKFKEGVMWWCSNFSYLMCTRHYETKTFEDFKFKWKCSDKEINT